MDAPTDDARPSTVHPLWRTCTLVMAGCLAAYGAARATARPAAVQPLRLIGELAPPALSPRAQQVLNRVDFDRAKLSDAVAALVRQAGFTFVPEWNAKASADTLARPVTLHLRHVSFAVAMDALLMVPCSETEWLGWDERAGVVTVAERSADHADPTAAVVRVYDVSLLVDRLPLPAAVDPSVGLCFPNLSQQNRQRSDFDEHERGEEVQQYIESYVDPLSWRNNGGTFATCAVVGRRLIVMQTPRNQRAVAACLRLLQSCR